MTAAVLRYGLREREGLEEPQKNRRQRGCWRDIWPPPSMWEDGCDNSYLVERTKKAAPSEVAHTPITSASYLLLKAKLLQEFTFNYLLLRVCFFSLPDPGAHQTVASRPQNDEKRGKRQCPPPCFLISLSSCLQTPRPLGVLVSRLLSKKKALTSHLNPHLSTSFPIILAPLTPFPVFIPRLTHLSVHMVSGCRQRWMETRET